MSGIKNYIYFIGCLLVSFQLYSSPPGNDLKKMRGFYKSKKNIYLEFTMTLNYINLQDAVQKHNCLYTHSDKGSFSKVFERTVLNNERYTLQIDAGEKTAVLSNYFKDGKEVNIQEAFADVYDPAADSVDVETIYNLAYKINTPEKKIISIKHKEQSDWPYDRIEITLAKDCSMKEIVYYNKTENNKQPQVASVVITYTKSDFQVPHNEYYDMSKYLEVKGSKLTATEKLKGYKIIDNRIKN